MTRGNQRDLARAKAAKKQADGAKGQRSDGLTVAQRKQRDADAMRAKQEAKAKDKEGGGAGGK